MILIDSICPYCLTDNTTSVAVEIKPGYLTGHVCDKCHKQYAFKLRIEVSKLSFNGET